MADKTSRAGGKILIPAQAIACVIATIAPSGVVWGGSTDFAPTSYLGSPDPNMVWEMLIAGVVVFAFLAAVALWVHSALRKVRRLQLRRNAFVSSRAEPAQPRRGDDGCAEPDRVLQRPLSRDLWPGSVGYFRKHDRTGTAGDAAQARRSRRQRRGLLCTRRHTGRPHYRTARRAVGSGQVFCAGERRFGGDARGLQRAAQAFEGAGIDQAVPGISTRQRAGMRGRPRASRTAAIFLPIKRSNASRVFHAT